MTDLNSQLNYSNNLHYQQQQQFQSHLHDLQKNIKTGQVDSNAKIELDKEHLLNTNQQNKQINQIPNDSIINNIEQQHQHHQPQHQQNPLNNNFNNNGLFSDTLSPFFAPYGIDVSHFPLTNPPIFESALMTNNNGFPRRRISISNGQIGQIITHDLKNDDFYDSQPPPLPKQNFANDDCNLSNDSKLLYLNQEDVSGVSGVPQVPQVPQIQQPQVPQVQQIPPQQVPQIPTQEIPPPPPPQLIKQEPPFNQGPTGIPNHKLVYNNEVIFNPDAGPIPGTAAWKKARLLERNRIAASKCRQRKKAANIQLKENLEKYQSQINKLKKDKLKLIEFYNNVKNFVIENGSGNGDGNGNNDGNGIGGNIKELNQLISEIKIEEDDDDDIEYSKFDSDEE